MKKIVFEYLSTVHPTVHMKRTSVGNVVSGYKNGNWYDLRKATIEDMMKYFNITYIQGNSYLNEWLCTLPVYKPIRNSTNTDVLISYTADQ